MANLNKVFLIGNLTRDPELRYTPKGTAVADLGLAITRAWTDEAGERREETTYVEVTLWARLAEVAGQYLSKGRPVMIEGRLKFDQWDDRQTGEKRSRLWMAKLARLTRKVALRSSCANSARLARNAPAANGCRHGSYAAS